MIVIVTSLAGDVRTLEVGEGRTVGDVVGRGVNSNTGITNSDQSPQWKIFHGGRALSLSTPLDDIVDTDGAVRLVKVPLKGSTKTRDRARKREPASCDDLQSPLQVVTNGKRVYSLANEGLDMYSFDKPERGEGRGRPAERDGDNGKDIRPTTTRLDCPTQLLGLLRSKYKDRLHYEGRVAGREGGFGEWEGIPERLVGCLERQGVRRLYTHQRDAWEQRGRNFIVTTATSSGKSVCYVLPVLEMLLEGEGCALVMFPTKALANDQLAKLRAMVGDVLGVEGGSMGGVEILDGDTAMEDREGILAKQPRVLVTNPDFLSMALPHHRDRYAWLFERLQVVVIDEAHVYSGVFGTHVACVVRRLKRLVRSSGPLRFYLSSATLANPADFAKTLVGEEDIVVIDRDASPSSEKRMVVWLPGLMARSAHRRTSPVYESAMLLSECMCAGLTTIVFAKTRKLAELVYGYTREILTRKASRTTGASGAMDKVASSLAVYRAGFTPLERREIEGRLSRGELLGVVATNALELGIDIGGLDCSIHLGWQGSRSSLWQQAGRTGRRGRKSLAFFVPFQGVLDEYFVRHPEQLFDPEGIEPTIVSLSNARITSSHLLAAAYEQELVPDVDLELFGSTSKAAAERLVREGGLARLRVTGSRGTSEKLAYTGSELNPAAFQLRSIDDETVAIFERGSSNMLEQIERHKAPFQLYPGAVYAKRGSTYLVENVDWNAGIAHVVPSSGIRYYTTVVDCTAVKTKTMTIRGGPEAHIPQAGPAEVSIRFTAFCRRRRKSGVAIDTLRLHDVPEVRYETTALTVALPKPVGTTTWSAEAVHCCAHAMIAVLPRFLGVSDADVGAECNVEHCAFITDRLLLFDKQGPAGLCERLAEPRVWIHVLQAAVESLASCRCKQGCPGCCHLAACSTYNESLDKRGASQLLEALYNCTIS